MLRLAVAAAASDATADIAILVLNAATGVATVDIILLGIGAVEAHAAMAGIATVDKQCPSLRLLLLPVMQQQILQSSCSPQRRVLQRWILQPVMEAHAATVDTQRSAYGSDRCCNIRYYNTRL